MCPSPSCRSLLHNCRLLSHLPSVSGLNNLMSSQPFLTGHIFLTFEEVYYKILSSYVSWLGSWSPASHKDPRGVSEARLLQLQLPSCICPLSSVQCPICRVPYAVVGAHKAGGLLAEDISAAPRPEGMLSCTVENPCPALPSLTCSGMVPSIFLALLSHPHGLFLVGPHFPFTKGEFRGRLTPSLLVQGVLSGCEGQRDDLTPLWNRVTHGR